MYRSGRCGYLQAEPYGQLEVVRGEQVLVAQDVARSGRRRRSGPPDRITARSHSSAANGRSWVTTSIVCSSRVEQSRAARAASAGRGSPTARRARAGAGPSPARSRSRRGGAGRARAGAARGRRRAPSARPPAPRHAVLASGARQAEVQRPERDVLAHGRHEQLVVGVLEHEPDARAQLAHVAAPDVDARRPRARPRRVSSAVEVEHQRRLAGAVGPEHRDALAVADRRSTPSSPATPLG